MPSPQLENGYTRISNEIMDSLSHFRIPGEVRQIIDCIIRKTYGYGKKEDWIANCQFVAMTGMDKGNIARSLSKAITHKLVIVNDNKLSLNKNYNDWVSFTGNHYNPKPKGLSQVTSPVIVSDTKVIVNDNKKLSEVTYTIDNKDNIQKKLLQKKEKNSSVAAATLSSFNKYPDLDDVKEEDMIRISENYSLTFNRNIPLSFVKNIYEDMVLWAGQRENNPKLKGRNWNLTLQAWVKKEALRIIERSHKGGIADGTHL